MNNTNSSQEHPLLRGLNERQQQAVITTEGPVLVIAGAGSGKTRALTHRVAYLMSELAIPGENILAVTFTNKAAQEMRDRITKLVPANTLSGGAAQFGGPSQLPTIGTFHSVCVRLLRKHIHLLNFESQFTIYDTADQLILMKHLLEDLKMNEKELNPKAVLAHISNAKNKLITPREFEAHYADSYFGEKVARLYGPYQERLQKNNAVDFDDILNAISFVDKIIFGKMNYNAMVSKYTGYKEYFNLLSEKVINFCLKHGKEYHIKTGTTTK